MFFRHQALSHFTRFAIFAVLSSYQPAAAEPAVSFPMVFTSPEALVEFGIELRKPPIEEDGKTPYRLPNLCYDYDRPGIFAAYPIAISNEFLARYKARGFTLETLCLGLISQAQFNPETGERLPTYMVRNDPESLSNLEASAADLENDPEVVPAVFETKQAFRNAIADFKRGRYGHLPVKARAVLFGKNFFTNIQPLSVPGCFNNGTPYLDCNWRFGLMKGKPMSEANRAKLREVGLAIERQVKDAMASGKPLTKTKSGSPFLQPLFWKDDLPNGLYDGQPQAARISQDLYDFDKSVAWIDIAPNLPRGYAYSLHGWALEDPAVSYDSIEKATDESKESKKFSSDKIKKIIED